jgi:hypothetical protein
MYYILNIWNWDVTLGNGRWQNIYHKQFKLQ